MYRQGYWVRQTQKLQICSTLCQAEMGGPGRVTVAKAELQRKATISNARRNRKEAVADSRNGAGNGSRLYEVNIWMWRYWPYGRGQPRRVTVAEAELQRKAAISDARKRAADTMKRRQKRSREGRGEYHFWSEVLETSPGPWTRVMKLPWIENQWCYIACYIPWYITHAILNAI